jgi:hypothetical protein
MSPGAAVVREGAGGGSTPPPRPRGGQHRRTLIIAGVVALIAAVAGALALTANSGHASAPRASGASGTAGTTSATAGPTGTGGPTPAPGASTGFVIPAPATAAPSSTFAVRRFGQVVLDAGQRVDLDAPGGRPWPKATSGDVPYDLEFTLAYRTLSAAGTASTGASLAEIKNPGYTYDDCRNTGRYGVSVPTADIRPGTEFCLITDQNHRSLGVVQAVRFDANKQPITVVLMMTTWEVVIPPGG